MHPTLLSLRVGGHEVGLHTYGLFVALGFAVGVVLFWREGRRQGFDGGRLLDLAFWGIVAGVVGSRVTFLALNARDFIDACVDGVARDNGAIVGCTAALRFWEGGFVFYGGVIGTGVVVVLFCRREGWSFWRLGDLAAPTLAVGHALGRLGCFFAGCCFGKTCPAPWAVSFPRGSVAYEELRGVGVMTSNAATTPSLHPTQLYEACGELGIFVLLLALRRKWRPADAADPARDPHRGSLILVYAAGYALLRFIVEIFRGDIARRYVVEWTLPRLARLLALAPDEPLLLSVSQLASLAVLAAVAIAWRRRGARSDSAEHPENKLDDRSTATTPP
jgi:phosphatidylglycerol:prolipoprotein diacylglycerol transferase